MSEPAPTPMTSSAARHTEPGLTERVARWCSDLRFEDLPNEAVTVARHCLLDWVGVSVAGAHEPLTDLLAEEVEAGPDGAASLVGRGQRARVIDAALVNGAAAHAIDYDDMHLALPGHPSTPVFAALLAVAEPAALDGRTFVRAAIVGLEVELRLGWMAQPRHYERGWHATATLGTVGAAVACAEALGADLDQRRHAIGLAVSQAAGLKSMFGTMTKPTQVGRAAANGALAARLAMRGMTSCTTALEDPQGLLAAYDGGTGDGSWDQDRLEVLDILFKYHASCYFTHAGIDAARQLRHEGLDVGAAEGVELAVHPANLSVCDLRSPRTGLEAKFSLVTTAAMALLGRDTSDPDSYGDAGVSDRIVQDLADRVEVHPTDGLERTQMRVRVRLADGTSHEASSDSGVPDRDLERQQARLAEKFCRLTEPRFGAEMTEQVREAILGVDALHDVGQLARNATGR